MPPDNPTQFPRVERFCNAMSWLSFGFILGFGVCAMLNDAGYTKNTISVIYWPLAGLAGFAGALPRMGLEIARKIRKHRQLAR